MSKKNKSKKNKSKKNKFNDTEIWTEEQYEEYLKDIYGMDFIAGFTENGVPYGTFIDDDNENDELIVRDVSVDSNDDLPF
jgi:hypothetical protein